MEPEKVKQVVAVYLRYFLSPSETFVYRQLNGISPVFDPIVLTAFPCNLHLYPVDRLFAKGKGLFGRVYTRLQRMATGRYTSLTVPQRRYWKEKLIENRVSLIHAHFGHFGLDMLDIAVSLGIPLLVTFHGFDASKLLKDPKYTRELKDLFEYAHVITVSNNMAERLAPYGVRQSRLNVHYIGVPVKDFEFVERHPVGEKIRAGEEVRFLQVSNFVEKKGHRFTVEAFARHLKKHPKHRLTFAGDGPFRTEIEALCAKHGIDDRVTFAGRVVKAQVSELMKDADVFLHHSVTTEEGDMEGIPTVIMEAMSAGLVVVSTKHSGIPELVEDGVEGYLVDERDVDAYVGALARLEKGDPGMPKKARQKIETKFSMSKQNLELQRIYERVIHGSADQN